MDTRYYTLCSKPRWHLSRELLVEDVGAEPVAGALDLGDEVANLLDAFHLHTEETVVVVYHETNVASGYKVFKEMLDHSNRLRVTHCRKILFKTM